MKLSIIVPVYNVEKYVRQCIESIISQTFNDYELIIVDDGSTDSSGEICDTYNGVKKIRVFHKENGGLSSARNYGIKMSTGQYLMFVDGDDYLFENTALSRVMEAIDSEHCDVVQYKIVQYFEKAKKYVHQSDIKDYDEHGLFNKLKKMNADGNFSISACDKIVKKDILVTNNILFDEGLLSEDIDWSLRLYQHVKNIVISNNDVYAYRQQRKGSITSGNNMERSNSLFTIIKYWYCHEYPDEKMKQLYLSFLAYQFLILLVISGYRKEYREYRSILKYDDNYKVRMFNKTVKLFGFRFGIVACKAYLKMKNKGLIKI